MMMMMMMMMLLLLLLVILLRYKIAVELDFVCVEVCEYDGMCPCMSVYDCICISCMSIGLCVSLSVVRFFHSKLISR